MKRKKKNINILESLRPTKVKQNSFGIWCKIYNDGSHFVATKTFVNEFKKAKIKRDNTEIKEMKSFFDENYLEAIKQGNKGKKLKGYMQVVMSSRYPEVEEMDIFVEENIHRMFLNYHNRVKRFERKLYLNKWNYFCTFTYDDKKHDEESFRHTLKRCLSNLASRRKWRYMGVWERGKKTERLHFHCILYVPDGEMVGEIKKKKDYSLRKKQIQETYINDFFLKRFGRNDFEPISDTDIKFGNVLEYLSKYISKDNERLVYSRGIPEEIVAYIDERDIASEYEDFVLKMVLYDDCIVNNSYRPITAYKIKQLTMFEMPEREIKRNYKNTRVYKFMKAAGINRNLQDYAQAMLIK